MVGEIKTLGHFENFPDKSNQIREIANVEVDIETIIHISATDKYFQFWNLQGQGGDRVLSPWSTSPRSTPGWLGPWTENDEVPKGTNSGIFPDFFGFSTT